jgi:hypothetical protein
LAYVVDLSVVITTVAPSSVRNVNPFAVAPTSVPLTAIVPEGELTGPLLCFTLAARIVCGLDCVVPETSTFSPA